MYASILSLILYQLVGNFTCSYLTQPILDNASLLIGIHFTRIKNLTKRACPLTNPPAFTLPLTFAWIFQCLDVSLTHHPHSKGLLLNEISLNCMGYENHNPCITCILFILDPSMPTNLNQRYTSGMILDPIFPAEEPCTHHQRNDILDRRFGVPSQITATS